MWTMLAAVAAISLPAPVTGDFDRDGKADTAMLKPANGAYDLIVHPGAVGRADSKIATFTTKDVVRLYLAKAPAGVEATACAKGHGAASDPCLRKSITLQGDTLDFGMTEASRAVAVWTGQRFEVVRLAD